jgi:hypothetical protein
MKNLTWLVPAAYGGCAGAFALVIIGLGGWVTERLRPRED